MKIMTFCLIIINFSVFANNLILNTYSEITNLKLNMIITKEHRQTSEFFDSGLSISSSSSWIQIDRSQTSNPVSLADEEQFDDGDNSILLSTDVRIRIFTDNILLADFKVRLSNLRVPVLNLYIKRNYILLTEEIEIAQL